MVGTAIKTTTTRTATTKSPCLMRKKWLIDKNEKLIEALINGLESERTQYKNDAEILENYWSRPRNPVLAGVSFAASIILAILGVELLGQICLRFHRIRANGNL